MKDSEIIKYFKMNLKSFIILTYLKTLRMLSIKQWKLSNYNEAWFISVGGSLFSLTLNSLFGTKLTEQIIKIYDNKKENYKLITDIVTTSLSIFYVLLLRYLYMKMFFQKDIMTGKYIQVGVISILSITFYTITIKSFFDDSHYSRFFNSLISDFILLLSSDFVEDAKIDKTSFDIQFNTIGTLFRIITNSIFKLI